MDIAAIRRDNPLPEVAGKIVPLRQTGREWVACCPFHADRSPSFTIYQAKDGVWLAHCFGCGWHGDVLDLVQRAYDLPLSEAARRLGAGHVPRLTLPPIALPCPTGRTDEARAIWQAAGPVSDTLGEAYLRFRGIAPPYPPAVRFAHLPYANLGALPCLVLAVQDLAGEVTGIQRVWLAADGKGKAEVASPKRSLGALKGGAIRLGDLDGSGTLTVCEGPEDGLSLLEMLGGPVWASGGLSFLPAMQFSPEVHSIIIGADNDPQGREGAQKAAQAYAARGLSVRIIYPLEAFKDFNDELKGAPHGR